MTAQRHERPPPSPLAAASAGAAFAVGVVVVLELLSLALPGPRGAFRTWGPVLTLLATPVIVLLGVPGAALVEAVARRAALRDSSRRGATAAGYLALALVAGTALWLAWRALVDPHAAPSALSREFAVLAAGAMAIWGGARFAERWSPTPLFVFAGAALALLVAATAIALA